MPSFVDDQINLLKYTCNACKITGDWVRWSVRTKVMTAEERREAFKMLTANSME